jgi:hypothetical protein
MALGIAPRRGGVLDGRNAAADRATGPPFPFRRLFYFAPSHFLSELATVA